MRHHQIETGDDGKQGMGNFQHSCRFFPPSPLSAHGASSIPWSNLHYKRQQKRSVTPPPRCPNNNNNSIQFSRSIHHHPLNDTDEEYEELLPLIERSEARRAREISNTRPTPWSHQVQVTLDVVNSCKYLLVDLQNEFTYLFSLGMTSVTPYTSENVRRTALFSRIILICIQMFVCFTLPGHENDGFKTYGDGEVDGTMIDRMINATLGGFTNWDGQYFLHVATRGYTHENTMAFFPLFPISIGFMARISHWILSPFLTLYSLAIILGVGFNVWCFQNAATVLAKLVHIQAGKNVELAERLLPTVIYLFCYNPASIFFTAFYTESLFAWLTFSCILALCQRNFEGAVGYASLSILCRSNGLLNFGLVGLVALGDIAVGKGTDTPSVSYSREHASPVERYTEAVMKIGRIGVMCLIGLIPFALFQLYCAKEFCVPERPGSVPAFCSYNGLPYTYIQGANWNVGFLQYFELKQIPNFVLAAPVLFTLGLEAQRHAKRYGLKLIALREVPYEDIVDLTLSLHGLFLAIFCLFFVHVQVSTRMIMSACPYIYVYIAKNLNDERFLFLSRVIQCTPYTTFINLWFGMYFLVGTVGFSLGYPWT